jgi:hypothetical protein
VERLLPTQDGNFVRSAGRPLFKEITDDTLIEIWQAVREAGDAAQPKPLSGLAQKRLMIWVVVDCLRSPVLLQKDHALKAGDRIWCQAKRVSDKLATIALMRASQRDTARAAAATYSNLEAGLATELAAINAAEETQCDNLRREVYTGLYEVAADPDAAPAPAPPIDPLIDDTAIPTPSTSTGVRYAWLIPSSPPTEREEVTAIPADLLASLSPSIIRCDDVPEVFTVHIHSTINVVLEIGI